jgi:hypothetical protein
VRSVCADLRGCVFLRDTGHWVQQQEPARVNAELLQWLGGLGLGGLGGGAGAAHGPATTTAARAARL